MKNIRILGLNQASYYASACVMSSNQKKLDFEIYLKERFERTKAAGFPIDKLISEIKPTLDPNLLVTGTSCFGGAPLLYEERLNKLIPYYKRLQEEKLDWISAKLNRKLYFFTHHYCHATAALSLSPYRKSLIVVIDGGGSEPCAFPKTSQEFKKHAYKKIKLGEKRSVIESCSVYLQNDKNLECVEKIWDVFVPHKDALQIGLGNFYETAARYIFNSPHEAGKVMGLAPLGTATQIKNRVAFWKKQDWKKSFKQKGKKAWESSPNKKLYANIAASVQQHYEDELISFLKKLSRKYPEFDNLILTGGCALNCIANMRVVESKLFKSVYVPPFPSDECISLGVASHIKFKKLNHRWNPIPFSKHKGNYGAKRSVPTEAEVKNAFKDYQIITPTNISSFTAKMLSQGHIIGWFQGRSECGPRALGQRSILVNPLRKGIKNHLNQKIKFRESFRPYSAACIWEKAHEYYEIPKNFDSPFMSFAPKVKTKYKKTLKEVSHIDGTSRLQTVRKTQAPLFYSLLSEFEKLTKLPMILNTSMNVMGEPIVETLTDAVNFFKSVPVDAIVVGKFYITKKIKK